MTSFNLNVHVWEILSLSTLQKMRKVDLERTAEVLLNNHLIKRERVGLLDLINHLTAEGINREGLIPAGTLTV